MKTPATKPGKIINYDALVKLIASNTFFPIYLFFGAEKKLINDALALLKKNALNPDSGNFNYEHVVDGEFTWDELLDKAETLPLMSARRIIVVEGAAFLQAPKKSNRGNTGNKETSRKGEAELLRYLENPCPTTCLVIISHSKIDTRKKVFKEIVRQGVVVRLDPLSGRALNNWIRDEFQKRGKTIEPAVLTHLQSTVKNDLFLLINEIEKTSLYVGNNVVVDEKTAQKVVANTIQAGVFRLTDAVGMKKTAESLRETRNMLEQGEHPLFIVYMLARQFRLILQAKVLLEKGIPPTELAQKMRIHPFVARNLLRQTPKFELKEIDSVLTHLHKLDEKLKSSKGEPRLLLELAIIKLCQEPPKFLNQAT